MKTKYLLYSLLLLALGVPATSCKQFEMSYYDQPVAINFIGSDNYNRDIDTPSSLKNSLNFAQRILLMTDSGIDTIEVKIRLQGYLSNKALRVSLYSERDENYPFAEARPTNPYIFEDSTYRMVIKVPVVCPSERNQDFKAILKFDYANSDVIAGSNTLQSYEITLRDEFNISQTNITLATWNSSYASVIGPYSENKARFMVKAIGQYNFSSYFPSGPGTAANAVKLQQLRDDLAAYNDAHPGNPLKDEHGVPILFYPD